MNLTQLKRIRWGVRAVLALGVAASTAANVLHAQDNPVSRTIAAWPPLALLLTVELISRVPVHSRRLAAARIVATTAIAGIAAYVSYLHMVGVAARYGETGASPYLIPLSVDGLIVVASICLVELGGRMRHAETSLQRSRPAPLSAEEFAEFDEPEFPDDEASSGRPEEDLRGQSDHTAPDTAPTAVTAVRDDDQVPAVEVAGVLGDGNERVSAAKDTLTVGSPALDSAEATDGEDVRTVHTPDPWSYAVPIGPLPTGVTSPSGEPTAAPEPVAEPASRPVRKRVTPRSLTAAERVAAAHAKEPGATHAQVAERAGVSVTTVKKYRPTSTATGQPSGPAPAETTRVNGHVPELESSAV